MTRYVTDGIGLVDTRAGVQEIRLGDVVFIELREKSTGTGPSCPGVAVGEHMKLSE